MYSETDTFNRLKRIPYIELVDVLFNMFINDQMPVDWEYITWKYGWTFEDYVKIAAPDYLL